MTRSGPESKDAIPKIIFTETAPEGPSEASEESNGSTLLIQPGSIIGSGMKPSGGFGAILIG